MTKLETKVAARNAVNALAKSLTSKVRESLTSFAGQKILLASGGGGTSAKFNKAVVALNLPSRQRSTTGGYFSSCYVSTGHGYSVTANFRVELTNAEAGTFYAEATLYLFDIDRAGMMVQNDAYLNHVDSDHYRTDFDAGEVVEARKRVEAARAVFQGAERALCSFGEHDNN